MRAHRPPNNEERTRWLTYLKVRMDTMQVETIQEQEERKRSEEESIIDSNLDSQYDSIGDFHYKRIINGDIDQEFIEPIVIST